jgi:hypothetical protein
MFCQAIRSEAEIETSGGRCVPDIHRGRFVNGQHLIFFIEEPAIACRTKLFRILAQSRSSFAKEAENTPMHRNVRLTNGWQTNRWARQLRDHLIITRGGVTAVTERAIREAYAIVVVAELRNYMEIAKGFSGLT